MQKFSVVFALLFANAALGASLRSRAGTQFITGVCTSDKACASDCCGFRTGKCAGAVIAQERDGGCGFGEAQSNDRAAVALGFAHRPPVSTSPFNPSGGGATPPPATPPPTTGSGKAPGAQFITGACANDGECASGCCGFKSGKCAGAIIALERDGGCGFGDAKPNDRAARALGFTGPFNPAGGAAPATPPATPPPTTPAPTTGSGKAPGAQFITGACANDGECASGCCGFKSGKCAGAIIALERDGGCGFGDAKPNDRAARALGFTGPFNPAGGAAPATPPTGGATPPATGGSGKAPGAQFITGVCAKDGDCASACCGFKSGKCAGPIIAQERDGGCGFGDAAPNDRAAKALRGRADPERYLL